MSEPRQFRHDPAGGFQEDRLHESPPPAWVCPSCQTVSVGPRCVKPECGWTPPDDDEPDAPTDLDAPDLGGSD